MTGRARVATTAGIAILTMSCLWLATQNVIFGDEGLFLVTYDQFLRDPERVARATSSFWLTDVIGALWIRLAPMPGVLAMRLGTVLAYVACAVIAWVIFRGRGRGDDRRLARWSIGAAIGLALASGYVYLEYTVLTAAVVTAASGLVLAGLRRDRAVWWLAAGVVVGMGIFLRLPNVLLPSLALVPIVCSRLERSSLSRAWRQSMLVLAGAVAGAAAAGALMIALHQTAYVKDAVVDLLSEPRSVHAPGRLLRDIARTLVLGGAHAVACWLMMAAAAGLAHRLRVLRGAIGTAAILIVVAAHLLLPRVDWYYTVLGLSAMATALAVATPTAPTDTRRIAVVGLWSLVLIGAGSAGLPWPLLLGLWLVLPIAMMVLIGARGPFFARLPPPVARIHGRLLIGTLATLTFIYVAPVAPYLRALAGRRPALLPHELSTIPADPRLWPVHTSASLASAVDDLLAELPSVVQPGDPVIVSNGIPLVIYLAGAKPFLDHPYPDLIGAARVRADLLSAPWGDRWPVWIRAKYMPAADFTVTHLEGSDFGATRESREALAAVLRDRGYAPIWQNALFEISKPPPAHARSR